MNIMLQELLVAYGQPHKDEAETKAFLGLYARMLGQYVDTELTAGAERLLKTRKYKTWPSVGECVDACEAVRQEIRARMAYEQGRERQIVRQQRLEPTPWEQAKARQFVDEVADGRIELFPNPPVGNVVDTGLLAKQLRRMARAMKARRIQTDGE